MTKEELTKQIFKKESYLCVGLDSDLSKIPEFLFKYDDPVFEFNKEIIEATHDVCVAYKPNTAFYECNGASGWKSLEKTINYIKINYPEIFVIADAKRGDIGNTSQMYARTFFQSLNADAVTVAPYMGRDSVMPFLEFQGKWVILLALTSNQGASDFQFMQDDEKKPLYHHIIQKSKEWGNSNNLMYVAGATKAELLSEIRNIIPQHFLLIPGIGAQGGDLASVSKNTLNNEAGILVNVSRSILFHGDQTKNFAATSKKIAARFQKEMKMYLKNALKF